MTIRPALGQTLLIGVMAPVLVVVGWLAYRDAPVFGVAAALIGVVCGVGAVRRSRQRLSLHPNVLHVRGGLLSRTIPLSDIMEVERRTDGSLVIVASGGRRIRFPGDAPKLAEFSDVLIKEAGLTDLRPG